MSGTCFRNIRFFVFCAAALNLTYWGNNCYLRSVIPEIEKQFDLPSTTSGLISASFHIGAILSMLPVTFLGGKIHRPKAVAFLGTVIAACSFTSALPHFLDKSASSASPSEIFPTFLPIEAETRFSLSAPKPHLNKESSDGAWAQAQAQAQVQAQAQTFHLCSNKTNLRVGTGLKSFSSESFLAASSSWWILILVAQLTSGAASSGVAPFLFSYVDDFSPPPDAAFYIGVLYAISALGPAFGFLVGAVTVRLPANFYESQSATFSCSPSSFPVGAWWLGFLLCGTLVLFATIPFWFFPQIPSDDAKNDKVKRNEDENDNKNEKSYEMGAVDAFMERSDKATNNDKGKRSLLRSFFHEGKLILSSATFVLIGLGMSMVMFLFSGWTTFIGKYMSQEFGISMSQSNALVGGLLIPAIVVGCLLGGTIMKLGKMQGRPKMISAMVSILIFVSICCTIVLFFAGSSSPSIAGVNKSLAVPNCSLDCSCSSDIFQPICSTDDQLQFENPCMAGCTQGVEELVDGVSKTVFKNCSCSGISTAFTAGRCPPLSSSSSSSHVRQRCSFTVFVIFVLGIVCSAMSYSGTIPATMALVLRAVEKRNRKSKSFGLGIQAFLQKLVGWIPGAVIYGRVIDSTCILWDQKSIPTEGLLHDANSSEDVVVESADGSGACLTYELTDLRRGFIGVTLAIQFASLLLLSTMTILKMRGSKSSKQDGDRSSNSSKQDGDRSSNSSKQDGDRSKTLIT